MSDNLNLLGLTAYLNRLSIQGMTRDSVERMIDLYHKKMLKKDESESETKPERGLTGRSFFISINNSESEDRND